MKALFFTTVFAPLFLLKAQTTNTVSCNLSLITTIQSFNVYKQTPSNFVLYKAKFAVDADGSPRAYGPSNSGLDWTANAGSTGNWWGVVTDGNGNPVIQGSSDPYPGMYVSTTSLLQNGYSATNPLHYTNSETIPFYVVPVALKNLAGMAIGDVAYVYNTTNGMGSYAIYADSGPAGALGEGSIYLATQLGLNNSPKTGGTSSGIIEYVIFPGSGFGQGKIPTLSQIDSIGNAQINSVGGLGLVNCLNPAVPIVIDNVAPTTQIITPNSWDTTNFVASFTDIDNSGGSGIEKSFYQVTDLNTSNDWRANNTTGFFNDDFIGSSIHTDWTQKIGTWAVASSTLQQSDEANSNTNMYTALTQTLSNRYLYHWKGAISGTGTSRRAGIHFFCDAPDSTNRGNSYFVYFRLDGGKIQTYKSVNNSWGTSFVKETTYTFVANQVYDFKISYDRTTGVIKVYVNDVLSSEWKDTSPLTTGTHVSFRSGNCNYKVSQFRVYRSRNATSTISIGAATTNYIRYQNQNPTTPSAQIKSLVTDSIGNLSTIVTKTVNIDWTKPSTPSILNDGVSADEDTTAMGNNLVANWNTATDANSGIKKYYYSVGTSAGATNVVIWTALTATSQSVTITGLTLTANQKYFVNVRTENNAGLFSFVNSTDGIIYKPNYTATALNNELNLANELLLVYPNPATNYVEINFTRNDLATIDITNNQGQEVFHQEHFNKNMIINTSHLAKGLYIVTLTTNQKKHTGKFIKE